MAEAPTPGGPPAALVSALRRLLRPLVRLLIAKGITLPFLTDLLKAVYVEVAEREFPVEGRQQTDSRLSLLTGVHRKDVRRLRAAPAERPSAPRVVSLNAQMIGLWLGSEAYRDADGRPRPLPRAAPDGPGPSFEGLVRSVSTDIRARAVLDEWVRRGLARVDEDDLVHLETRAFVPDQGFEELAYYFGRNLHDHIAAGTHNLTGGSPRFLERSVYYDRLTPESVEALAKLAEKVAMEGLLAVNREAVKRAEADDGKPGATRRMNFGAYFFGADDAPDPDAED